MMRVDFFLVEAPQRVVVADLLTQVLGLPDNEERTVDISAVPYRIQTLTRNARYWDGDIVRIRMTDVPPIISRSGEMNDVPLEDDQGLGEETAFRYDARTRVLAIQANRAGVSASKWARFLETITHIEGAIVPTVVIEGEGGEKVIRRLGEVRKYRVRYAGLHFLTCSGLRWRDSRGVGQVPGVFAAAARRA